jgi:hypothetical protein
MLRKYLGVLAILAALFIGANGAVTPAIAQTNGEVPWHRTRYQVGCRLCGALCELVMLDRHR